MSWIKNKISEIFIISVSILISLIIFEFFLILENKSKPVVRTSVQINGYEYQFIKDEKIPNVFKKINNENEIFVIGDSFVEGIVCAADKKNFPCHLEKKTQKLNDVLNLGIGGKNPVDYVDFVDNLKMSSKDKVILVLYDNDIHLTKRNCDQIKSQLKNFNIFLPDFCKNKKLNKIDKSNRSIIQKINNKIKNYKTFQIIKETVFQIPFLQSKFYRTEYRNRWTDFNSDENKWMISSLKIIKQIVESKGASIIFTYYPNTNNISDDDNRHLQWLNFINYANIKHNLKILDPYPYFIENSINKSMVWSLTDKHPNCDAHKLMAEFIFQELKKLNMLN